MKSRDWSSEACSSDLLSVFSPATLQWTSIFQTPGRQSENQGSHLQMNGNSTKTWEEPQCRPGKYERQSNRPFRTGGSSEKVVGVQSELVKVSVPPLRFVSSEKLTQPTSASTPLQPCFRVFSRKAFYFPDEFSQTCKSNMFGTNTKRELGNV